MPLSGDAEEWKFEASSRDDDRSARVAAQGVHAVSEEALREPDPREVARQPTRLFELHTGPASDDYSGIHLGLALRTCEWRR